MKQLITKIRKKFSNYMIRKMIKKEGFDQNKMFHIEVCRGAKRCSRNVIDVNEIEKMVTNTLKTNNLAARLQEKLTGEKLILPHHMFKLAVSGCMNGCSKPQIKDFGIIGQLKPVVNQEACTGCQKCIKTCSENAISWSKEELQINFTKCIFCGDCLKVCPPAAITEDKTGYQIQAGGHLGRHPRLATTITNLSPLKQSKNLLTKATEIFIEKGEGQERLGVTLNNLNINLK